MKRWEIYSLLIVLCLLVFANSLGGVFVSDDAPGIVENPKIAATWDYLMLPHDFLDSVVYSAVKLEPWLYHLVSILVHCLNAVLVYHVLRLFFAEPSSILGASLFAVHPAHVEAVAWVSGRPYALLGTFVFAVFLMYERAARPLAFEGDAGGRGSARRVDRRMYGAALLVFVYYLYRNYAFFIFIPAMLLAFDAVYGRLRRTWPYLIPFFVIPVLRVAMERGAVAGRMQHVAKEISGSIEWTNPLFNMTYSLYTHMGILIWPWKLSLYHEPPVITVFRLKAGLVGLAVLAPAMVYFYRRAKPLFFGLCVFGIFLAPTYSPVTISWLLAERYLYVPSLALSIFLAFGYERFPGGRLWQRYVTAGCCIVIAAYAARSVIRNEDWRTPARLWRSTVEVTPLSPRAHNNLGDVLAHEGNYEGAIRAFKRAMELKPGYADPIHNLANVYDVLGQAAEAEKYYRQAIELNPQLYQSYLNLGRMYMRRGETAAGEEFMRMAQEKKAAEQAASVPGHHPVRDE